MSDQSTLTLDQLLADNHITKWDLCIICDGGGQGWDKPIGWAAAVIDAQNGRREVLAGGSTHGTVNLAELEPVLYALRWDFYGVHKHKLFAPRYVVIFTDSYVTANTGNGVYSPASNNPDAWMALSYFQDQGYKLQFCWQARNTNPLHAAVDQATQAGRGMAQAVEWLKEKVYELLP